MSWTAETDRIARRAGDSAYVIRRIENLPQLTASRGTRATEQDARKRQSASGREHFDHNKKTRTLHGVRVVF